MYLLLGLLQGRQVTFPQGNENALEFELLYVGELAVLLVEMGGSLGELGDMYPEFTWTNGRELLNIGFEYV
jgi:hypothetical protein